ncbi:MAG TPA: sigma-70 family RNA polymerase sigma factor [Nitrosopumilaceae archaeon]|jgi:RNA polymerase sigma factor (sigma-70 family)|nr:sigma-70 family RNA polymerase sigma factor [Nitrosopumilaceae archaeon]
MKNKKTLKSAPLYLVLGTISKGTELNIRVMPLTRAVRKDKNWVYPSEGGNKTVPVKSLNQVENSIKGFKGYCLKSYIGKLVSSVKSLHAAPVKKAKKIASVKTPASISVIIASPFMSTPAPVAVKVVAPVKLVSPVTNKEYHQRDQEDIEAVNEILAGNKNKFAILYKRYYANINYKYSSSLRFNKELADDLTADLFVKVYENLHNYKPNYTFNSWITRVAKNFLIDYIRKPKLDTISIDAGISSEKMKNESAESMTIDVCDDSALTPEESFIASQKTELLQNVLNSIDSKCREVINLRFFDDKSYEEIAEQLEMSMNSVKSIIFRSKAKLKELVSANKVMMAAIA